MASRETYKPGAANGAKVEKNGDHWKLVFVRELRHPPTLVWEALTDPAQLAQWAPFDADRNMGTEGTVTLSTANVPQPQVSESQVTRAEAPRLLEYTWGGGELRWQLEPHANGTRLTLWHSIDRRFVSWGAAGWHICLDVMDHLLAGDAIGRIVGPDALQFGGWKQLNAEYAAQFGVEG